MSLNRWILPLLGGVYGLCFYLLADAWPAAWNHRFWLFLIMFWGVFGAAGLMFVVPLGLRKAALISATLAAINALLMLWVSFGFDEINGDVFTLTGRVWITTVLMPMPFLLCFMQTSNGLWNYDCLYRTAWGLFARYALAGLFSAIGIGTLWGFSAALNLVGVSLLEDILNQEHAFFFIWGTLFGLGVAVLYEVEEIVNSVLRLVEFMLRAFLPVIAALSTVFLIALFVNLGDIDKPHLFLFNNSIAGFYGAILLVGVIFLTAACSVKGQEVQNRIMIWMCRVMAVNSGVLALLVLWAVVQRVGQYGWTPDRLLLCLLGLLGAVYGLGYTAALWWKEDWWSKIRQVNIVASVFAMLAGFLWLTPLLDANRISARSQEARVLAQTDGAQDAEKSLKRWGKAGTAALARLQANPKAMAFLETSNDKRTDRTEVLDRLIYLSGEAFIRSKANDLKSGMVRRLKDACPTYDTEIEVPKCYAAHLDVTPQFNGKEILVFAISNLDNTDRPMQASIDMIYKGNTGWGRVGNIIWLGFRSQAAILDLLEQLEKGDISIVEIQTPALKIGNMAYRIDAGPVTVE